MRRCTFAVELLDTYSAGLGADTVESERREGPGDKHAKLVQHSRQNLKEVVGRCRDDGEDRSAKA